MYKCMSLCRTVRIVLRHYIPRLFSMMADVSSTSPISLEPAMKSAASSVSSSPRRISSARLCEPPRGREEADVVYSRG